MAPKNPERVYITSDQRAKFANDELAGLLRNYAQGSIRSVIIATVWDDGVVGGNYSFERHDKTKLLNHLRNIIRQLEA